MSTVRITGVATTEFGRHHDRTLASISQEAALAALDDAGISAQQVEAVVFSNAAEGVLRGQEMIRAQVSLRGSGLDGLPMFNTENACASGSSAVHLGWNLVLSGRAASVLIVGAEKLHHENKVKSFEAIESGIDRSIPIDTNVQGSAMMAAYANEALAYAREHGDVRAALAAIAVKNRHAASLTDFAQFRQPITPADVAASRMVSDPLRLLMCSPVTDGAAALVLRASNDRADGPRVASSEVASHGGGSHVVEAAVRRVYEDVDCSAEDIDVFQLHDASSIAELIQYEQVGLTPVGTARDVVLEGRTAVTGDRPVNTDGGLMSRGHALGATGVAQLVELTRQLRGNATGRQVNGATSGLAVNAGGWMGNDYATCVATILTSE